MFEDFSFSSPSSRPRGAPAPDDRLMVDCDSTLISPLSSRCPSPRSSASYPRFPRSLPRSRSFRQQAPTSVPLDAYDLPSHDHHQQKRLSITTLTRKLHEHTIQSQAQSQGVVEDRRAPGSSHSPVSPVPPPQESSSSRSSRFFPGYVLTPPPDSDHEDGYFHSHSSRASPSSPHFHLSPSPTSVPTTDSSSASPPRSRGASVGLEGHNWDIRARRQHISRLQCNPADWEALRRALQIEDDRSSAYYSADEDCHPSSLPPQQSPPRYRYPRRSSRLHPHPHPQRNETHSEGNASSSGNGSGSGSGSGGLRSRRKSSPSSPLQMSSHSRVEKNVGERKKSEQGLRRKSLVSAALASIVEGR